METVFLLNVELLSCRNFDILVRMHRGVCISTDRTPTTADHFQVTYFAYDPTDFTILRSALACTG